MSFLITIKDAADQVIGTDTATERDLDAALIRIQAQLGDANYGVTVMRLAC